MVARDPSCFAGSCTPPSERPGSYARWFLDRGHPYFGAGESPVADFNPDAACPAAGTVAFHWRALPPAVVGSTRMCVYVAEPTRFVSGNVTIDTDPASTGSPTPGPWFTAGPADANNDAPIGSYDLMSTVAHEIGHVLGFGEYRQAAPGGPSVDAVCLDGSDTEDPRLGNNTNRETMCVPQFRGTERQRTPEEHEKAALRTLCPPTGASPTMATG